MPNPCQGGEGGNLPPPGGNDNQAQQFRSGNKVYKSGPLFLSSKVGIGWTTWKKRWFILTRTSLVFFRSDPTVAPKRGGEVNLTLGGIDLNSSGSVVVKEDKKLLTVLFPDGRDGRAFTLKAETLEDLLEWKNALEEALANAPNAALVMGQNGIFRNDQGNALDASDQSKDRQPAKSLVIGRPILLALEDIDGTASFLEKALKFVEEYGVKVEGILRQAADVDDVEHRIREYEQGKREFSPDEDAHVIADCVKYILRELPSSPVPASCCNALLEAYRTAHNLRVNAMRTAILETFPEPNRRLLQRILTMMQKVASHKNENRMSISAVAACMAPLLLRPLLAGECDLDNNFDMGGDSSVQLLKAAAAANHAQAIVIILLEEYTNLFGEGSDSPELYSDSDDTEDEELSDDDDESYNDEDVEGADADRDDDCGHASTCTTSETGENEAANKVSRGSNSSPESLDVSKNVPKSLPQVSVQHEGNDGALNHSRNLSGEPAEASTSQRSIDVSNDPGHTVRRPAVRARARGNNLPLECIDFTFEEDPEVQRLEAAKLELENSLAEEAKGNTLLKESLVKRKNALQERRLALQKDVARLQEQLQKERELRMVLEAGLKNSQRPLATSPSIDEATKAELEEIAQAEADVINLKQKADDLGTQLNKQREQNSRVQTDTGSQPQQNLTHQKPDKNRDVDIHPTSQAQEKPVRSKHDTSSTKADSDRDKKNEHQSSVNKQSKQYVQHDASSNKAADSDRDKKAEHQLSVNKQSKQYVQHDASSNKVTDSDRDKKAEHQSSVNKQSKQYVQHDASSNKAADSDRDRKNDYQSPVNKQSKQSDTVRNPNTSGALVVAEPGQARASTSSKKCSSKNEGVNASSALSKLTNRLNFLKERRTQIANELLNLDKSLNSCQAGLISERKGSDPHHSSQNISENQSSEKGKGAESSQATYTADSPSLQNPDRGKR